MKERDMRLNPARVFVNNIFFVIFLLSLQIVSIVLFAIYTKYQDFTYGSTDTTLVDNILAEGHLKIYYPLYQDISMMLLIGYGFLIVFMRFHRWNSLGVTLFVAAFGMQYYILWQMFWKKVFLNLYWGQEMVIDFRILIEAEKGAIAVLISLGALMGKVDYFQTLFFLVFELGFYTCNEALQLYKIFADDAGGGMIIHLFAGVFGVAASWIYSPKYNTRNNPNKIPSYSSSTLAFFGTMFLWIFFPSFNAAEAQSVHLISLAATNTIYGLTASAFLAFGTSALLKHGKFTIEHILNATLAGGVVLGATADLIFWPFIALLFGSFAGILSVLSFNFLGPALERIKLFDTRGILHLHAIPGLFSGILSAILCGGASTFYVGNSTVQGYIVKKGRNQFYQGGAQIAMTGISLAIALIGGCLAGVFLRLWRYCALPEDTFGDQFFWKLPPEAIPEAKPSVMLGPVVLNPNPINLSPPGPQMMLSPGHPIITNVNTYNALSSATSR